MTARERLPNRRASAAEIVMAAERARGRML